LLLCAILLIFQAHPAFARQATTQFGIHVDENTRSDELLNQLENLRLSGISVIELHHPVDERVLDRASELGYQIFIRSKWKFLTLNELHRNFQDFESDIRKMRDQYVLHSSVSALGLYSLSSSNNTEFSALVQQALNTLSADSLRTLNVYEVSTLAQTKLVSIRQVNSTVENYQGVSNIWLNKAYEPSDLFWLNTVMEQPPNLLLFDYEWFIEGLQLHPALQTALQHYTVSAEFLLPNPFIEIADTESFNWLIMMYALLWIITGVLIFVSAGYKGLISRFYTYHRFFVDDVMRYRERSSISGFVLLVQHALFTGLLFAIMFQQFVSQNGLQVLHQYFPGIFLFGVNYFSVFIFSAAITLLVVIFSLFWLYVPSKSMRHFSQAINLYSWNFHLDFVLVSLVLILYLTGKAPTLMIILSVSFFINSIISFILAATDSASYLVVGKMKYLGYTMGLHLILILVLILAILSSAEIMQVLRLALTI
jgi:hypothetical protein